MWNFVNSPVFATLTSAVLDPLLHHAETVIVEGRSYRMKDQIEPA
jgi:DNA replication protein DnaC